MLTQGTGGRAFTRSETLRRGDVMSTYEEFMIILTFAGLVVSILNLRRKNHAENVRHAVMVTSASWK